MLVASPDRRAICHQNYAKQGWWSPAPARPSLMHEGSFRARGEGGMQFVMTRMSNTRRNHDRRPQRSGHRQCGNL